MNKKLPNFNINAGCLQDIVMFLIAAVIVYVIIDLLRPPLIPTLCIFGAALLIAFILWIRKRKMEK